MVKQQQLPVVPLDSNPQSCRQFLSKGILLDGPLPLAGIYDLAQLTPKAYMPPGKRGRR
jgi:hypothetical protein